MNNTNDTANFKLEIAILRFKGKLEKLGSFDIAIANYMLTELNMHLLQSAIDELLGK